MGWFDKSSWQLRQKIKDLQADLALAEREGKYVVEQGLFFAELDEMGDATIVVLGKAGHVYAEEENVVKNFFDRNGFTVERLKLDRTQKSLSDVEIIPPEELTRHVARILKNGGYRMIDDSEHERPADLEHKVFPLSAVVRSVSSLFVEHVHNIIVTTSIKMNMEGNRLLHWLPLIHDSLLRKTGSEVPEVAREAFFDGYNHYYARFGHLEQEVTPTSRRLNVEEEGEKVDWEEGSHPPSRSFTSREGDTVARSTNGDTRPSESLGAPWSHPGNDGESETRRRLEVALTLAQIYKGLVGASQKRQVRNVKSVLDEITRLFQADQACMLVPGLSNDDFDHTVKSGLKICLDGGEEDRVIRPDHPLVRKCIETRAQIVRDGEQGTERDGQNGEMDTEMAAPVMIDQELRAVIYVEKRGAKSPYTARDAQSLAGLAEVFQEFPDLLLRSVAKA